jgi:prevent-host-death family protein
MAKRTRKPKTRTVATHVASAEFKTRCLELLSRVRETGAEYVVTKHGVPVAKVVAIRESPARPIFGSMAGTVIGYDRPFDPLDGEYDINRR